MLKTSKKLLNNLPFRLLLCIIFAFTFGDQLSDSSISFMYTISSMLKEILMTILPIMIFSYIFAALLSLERTAPMLIIFILVLVTISNALASFTAYFTSIAVLPLIALDQTTNIVINEGIITYFTLGIPQIISSDKVMFAAMILGLFFSSYKVPFVFKLSNQLQKIVSTFLEKCFIPVLPLYILGFVLKMHREGSLSILFKNYAQVFILICVLMTIYISLMYLIANKFSFSKFKQSIRQMFAAGLTGFSTISSAVTVPLSIAATEVNIKDSQFAKLIIPATVNIHMMGHGLSIPISSLTILLLSGMPLPSLETFAVFVVYFCIAKFSATGVPGGGIIVILPILQSQLGFTPEMASIIIMLDILQDAVLTAANVMGNGAFAMICHRLGKKLRLI
jgi:Na+/H+-dicarboxylate symporter